MKTGQEVAELLALLTRDNAQRSHLGLLVVVFRDGQHEARMSPYLAGELNAPQVVFACEMMKHEFLRRCDEEARDELLQESDVDELRRELGLPEEGTVRFIP